MKRINLKSNLSKVMILIGLLIGISYLSQSCNYLINKPSPPTDILLSNSSIKENEFGATVGTLSATDPNSDDTFYYTLIQEQDAEYFKINDTTLKLKPEIKFLASETPFLTIKIKVTDSSGKTATKTFTITVNPS